VLAAAARLAGRRRLGTAASGAAGSAGRSRPDRLEPRLPRRCQRPGKKGGAATGRDPTNRGKPGTKRHVVSDRRGTPLACLVTGANRHESVVFEDLIDAIPAIKQPRGRPRKRPATLHADKAYDIPRCRQFLRRRRIKARIARKGIEPKDRLGRHRWVVERTLAWLNQFRRLTARYERRQDIHEAFLSLGCSLICFNAVVRFC
jgi:transposase